MLGINYCSRGCTGVTRAYAIFKPMIWYYEDVGARVVDFKKLSRDIKEYIEKHDSYMII